MIYHYATRPEPGSACHTTPGPALTRMLCNISICSIYNAIKYMITCHINKTAGALQMLQMNTRQAKIQIMVKR